MGEVNHIKDLHADKRNRRKHNARNIGMIERALGEVGAARSIVIDEDNNILAGNGTIEAAASAGIERVQVVEADGETIIAVRRTGLTEAQKRKLALYDNRTAELADWDVTQILTDMQEGMSFDGLFTNNELDALIRKTSDAWDEDVPDDAIGGAASPYQLKTHVKFPSSNRWGIPDLDPAMLAAAPDGLTTWAGSHITPRAPNYLCVYKWRSLEDIDTSKHLLSFYTHDSKISEVWDNSAEVTERLLAQRWLAVVSPNFSLLDSMPFVEQLWQTFKARWCARYWQSVGLRVIPDIDWIDDASFEFCVAGVSRDLPCVAIQVHTKLVNDDERRQRDDGIARICAELNPSSMLVYGAHPDYVERVRDIASKRRCVFVDSAANASRRYRREKSK